MHDCSGPGGGRVRPHTAAAAAAPAGVMPGAVCGDGYVYTYAWICAEVLYTYIDESIESDSNMLLAVRHRMEMRSTQYMREYIQ